MIKISAPLTLHQSSSLYDRHFSHIPFLKKTSDSKVQPDRRNVCPSQHLCLWLQSESVQSPQKPAHGKCLFGRSWHPKQSVLSWNATLSC